jgi:hypothetical protein
LTSVVIPDSVTSIGTEAFAGCPITKATLPTQAISAISKSNLQKVVITSGTEIGEQAFQNCSSLTSVEIGDSVTSIGSHAFADCSSLRSITIPNSVTKIDARAFEDCYSLTSIEIPDSVTSIGASTFEGCSGLTEVVIPDGVTRMGGSVFYDCYNLTIYCEAESKPDTWGAWNASSRPVIWGYVPHTVTAAENIYNQLYAKELHVDNSVEADSFCARSDLRLKENITEFKPQNSILELPIVEFDFKKSGEHQIGCIAQDLQKICPEIVEQGPDGFLKIQESKIVYLLLDEVKKLKAELEQLKEEKN